MPIYSVKAPNGKIYEVNAPEDAKQEDLFGFVQQQLDEEERRREYRQYGPGFLKTFGQSAARGAGQLASTFTDIIPAAVGSALGFEDYAKEQLKEAEEKRVEREAKYPTLFRSYKEIEGLGDFAKFATETVGEQLANIATSLVPGVGVGALAGRTAATGVAKGLAAQAAERGLAGEAAEQFIAARLKGASSEIAKTTLRGQAAGAYLGSYALNAPEVFENIYEETGELAPGAAALFGSVSAALDAILPAQLAKQIAGPTKAAIVGKVLENSGMEKGLARSLTAGILKGAAGEGLTEGAQEAISIAAERFVDDNPGVFGSKEWNRIVESAVKGAVAGGAFGGVGGGVQGLRERAEVKRQEAEEARIRGEEERAQQLEAEAARIEQEAEAASAQIEALQRPTTEAEQEAYGVEAQAGPFSPVMPYGPVTSKEYKKQEAQFKKDQQELKARLEELAPTGELDLAGLAQRPSPIEQTLQKAEAPLTELQKRGLRKGELGLEAQRAIGWNEDWTALVPNIAELGQPEFRKALTSDVTIPVTTRQGIIESGKKAGIIPKTARYSYPDITSTKIDDLRKVAKEVFGLAPNASVLRNPPEKGGIAGLDFSNPEHLPVIHDTLTKTAETTTVPEAATKIERLLDKFPLAPQPTEGAPTDVTRTYPEAGGAGVEVPSRGGVGATTAPAESTQPSGVDVAASDVGRPAVGEVTEPSALTPRELAAAEAEFLGEEQIPVEERAALLRRRTPTPEEARATEKEATEIIETEAPVEPIPSKTIRKLVNEFFGEHYLDPDKKLYLPKYEGPAFDQKQRALAETGDINGLIRNLLDSNKDPAIKQVLRRLRSLNLKTKLVIGEPGWQFELEVKQLESEYGDKLSELAKKISSMSPLRQESIFGFTSPSNLTFTNQPQADGTFAIISSITGEVVESGFPTRLDAIEKIHTLRKVNREAIKKERRYKYGQSGAYDPATDTITLDPTNGLNAHTFIHEVLHAAISNVLRNTNHPLTKQFEKFFMSIKDRVGNAYGGTDLQEFAAELISNPSFQALLKSIKTPRSESLFMNILRKIAEFFGFAKESTAFTQGLKFIDAALDVTGGMEAVPGEKMFLSMGDFAPIGMVGKAMPALVGRTVEDARNTLSNLGGGTLLEEALGALRLDNLRQIYKQLPSIDTLQDALERRMGREEADIKKVNDNYTKFVAVQQKHPEQMRLMDDLSIDASKAEVDITKPFQRKRIDPAKLAKMSKTQRDVFDSAERKREHEHNLLRERYLKINPEVREVYETIRKQYDDAFNRYRKLIEDAAEGQPGLAAQLREEFETKHPLTGYVPFLRRGDYWLEFTSPETDSPVVMAFESIRERDQFIEKELKGIDHRKFQRFEDIQYNADNIPPTHFISKVITGLRQKNASQEQINSVYQAYLAAFPAESMAKQFIKRRGVEGMDKDLIRGYGDLMVKWTRKLNNSEFLPQIDRALMQIAQEAADQPPDVAAAAKSILRQKEFFHNPSYGKWISAGTALSYYEFMAGNISSGIINLTSLPLMVYPMLTGKFNPVSALGAMASAMKESLPGNNWQSNPKYKQLYDTLMEHGQLEHTMAREVLEGRRQKTGDYTGFKARVTELVSLPFSVSEKWNRATTAIAAYNLEYERTKNKDAAIKYALETVRTAHTSGMAVTGPRWLQAPLGRLFGTFKSIIWQQAFVIARAFYEAAKGESPEVRKAARHQLLAMYGMATIFVGVKGMPFYGAMSVLAEMLNTLFGDDDEPFDFDEFMRDLLPMFLYKGLVNYALNLEVANRAGLANDIIFRDDPRGVAQHGYVLSALQQAFGPLASIGVNAERSVKLFKDGEYMRSFEASLPSAMRNVLKGVRYMQEGALTLDGEPIMDDISTYNSVMQLVGFSPADLSNRYEMISAAKGFERQIMERRQKAIRMVDMAITSGDMDTFYEAMERVQKFNESNPDFAITPESLQRSQRARMAAEKEAVYGIRFNKKLLPRIRSEFFEDEE